MPDSPASPDLALLATVAAPDPVPHSEAWLARGTTLGRYVLLDRLGAGGMGVVYSAYDTQLERKIAIKLMRRRHGTAHADGQQRMLREAQAMARLVHPNVVAVHDVGTFEGQVFLAMDYVHGGTLGAWLKAPRPLGARLEALRAAGRGLAAAHAAGIIHRDFKPDNVLVGDDGRVVVTDFGLARGEDTGPEPPSVAVALERAALASPGPGPSGAPRLGTPLTVEGSVMGTFGFMPPEQLTGAPVTAATDQFAFAVSLYLALYGEMPFPVENPRAYATALLRPVRDAPKGAQVPAWLRRVALRGLAIDVDRRFPSLEALLEALAHDPTRRRRWVAWAAAGAAGVALVAGALVGRHREALRACNVASSELAGVWDAALAAELRRSFTASGVPDASGDAERVSQRLDEFASRWREARGEACRASRVEQTQPEDVYRLRTECLDRERSEVRAETSLLARADPQVVRQGLSLAYGLPDVRWCADVPALRASVGLPDDPVKRAKVSEIRDGLAEVSAAFAVGRTADAAAKLTPLIERARQLGHAPTTARALDWQGKLLVDARPSDAYPVFRDALWIALAAGDRDLAVELSANASKTAAQIGRAEESHEWLDGARALLAGMGSAGSHDLTADVLFAEAFVADTIDHRPEVALADYEQLVSIDRPDFGVHPKTAQALYNVSSVLADLGRFADARPLAEESLAMYESIGGPESRDSAVAEYGLGCLLLDLGELDRGDELLSKAVATMERLAHAFWVGAALTERSRGRLLRGLPEQALADAERVRASAPTHPRLMVEASVVAGDALNRLGRFAPARDVCEQEAKAMVAAEETDPTPVTADDPLRCEAEALLGLGSPAEALRLLERSLLLEHRLHPGDYARAELAAARALTALHEDPERARSLATKARDELARTPHLAPELERAEQFLREPGHLGR